jgi:hypothetical protein
MCFECRKGDLSNFLLHKKSFGKLDLPVCVSSSAALKLSTVPSMSLRITTHAQRISNVLLFAGNTAACWQKGWPGAMVPGVVFWMQQALFVQSRA